MLALGDDEVLCVGQGSHTWIEMPAQHSRGMDVIFLFVSEGNVTTWTS